MFRSKFYTASLALLVLIGVLVLVAGCSPAAQTSTPTEARVQLSWIHNGVWSPFYIAEKQDFFSAEQLNVTLRTLIDGEGNFLNVADEVSSGRTEFGIMSAAELLEARAQGKPFVAVATLYQRHPLMLLSLAEKNIVRPEDLVGKKVQVSANSQLIFQALLNAQGISPSDIDVVERTDFTSAPLLDGSADVIDAWVTNEVAELSVRGYELNMISPTDYGVEMYPNVVFTTEAMIAEKPEVVQRFVKAFARGLQGAVDNPELAAQLTVEYNGDLTLDEQKEVAARALPLINPAGSKPGMMQADVWNTTYRIMRDQNMIAETVSVDDAFDLTFIQRVYQS